MSNDPPWKGLAAGAIDSRRVDHSAKWNFFWVVMSGEDPALALVLDSTPISTSRLPKLRSLETGFALLSGSQTFYLRLKDHTQLELFETLCRDVISCAALATAEPEALTRAMGRTYCWHRLLRGGGGNGLTEEEQKGLIGELAVLKLLSEAIGLHAAITAWTGPTGSPKDFQFHGHCIEVKARSNAAQPYVQISNEFQLADVNDHRLWLCVLPVDKVGEPFGNSLDFFVDSAASLFRNADSELELIWEIAITATGYRAEDSYSNIQWVVGESTWYEVLDGFPSIELPLKSGVTNVKYNIALAACDYFKVDGSEVIKAFSEDHKKGNLK